MKRRVRIVDVFGSGGLSGNPVAVVLDSEELTDIEMLEFTRWMNLSETTFVFPPTDGTADYAVRIFTLSGELPFAGHPTLGTCHAWLAENDPGSSDSVIQECGAGLVTIRRGDQLAFSAPPLIRSGPVDGEVLEMVAGVIGVARGDIVDAAWVDNGPGWMGVLLRDARAVLDLRPDFSLWTGEDPLAVGAIGPYEAEAELAYEIRAFFEDDRGQMLEDPVTGSLNASVAGWMLDAGRVEAPFMVGQGQKVGRDGRVGVEADERGIWIAGATRTFVEGSVDL